MTLVLAAIIQGILTNDVQLHAWYTDATVRNAGFYLPVIDLFASGT